MHLESIINFWNSYQNILSILFSGAGVAIFIWLVNWYRSSKTKNLPINSITVGGNSNNLIQGDGNKIDNRHYHQNELSTEKIDYIVSKAMSHMKDEFNALQQEKIQLAEAIKVLSNQDSNQYDIGEALNQLEQGNNEIAKGIFHQITKDAEENNIKDAAESYRHLGAIAYLNNTDDSINAYKRATQLDPSNGSGWNQLGHLLRRTCNFGEAENAYLQLLNLAAVGTKNQAVAYGNLAIVYYMQGNIEKSKVFVHKSLAINEKLGCKEGLAAQYCNLGNLYKAQGKFRKAAVFYQKSLSIHELLGLKQGIASQYGNLGAIHQSQYEMEKAIEYYKKSLAINVLLGDNEEMATLYNNFGMVYHTIGDLEKAVDFYQKSLSVNEILGRKINIATDYGNLGLVFKAQGNLAKAVEFYEKSLVIDKQFNNKEGIANQYGNLGNVYETQGDSEKAIEYYQKSLDINIEIGRTKGIANQYGSLGNSYRSKGDLVKAVEFYQKSLDINEALGDKEGIAINCCNLGMVSSAQGDMEKTLIYWNKSLTRYKEIGAKTRIREVQSWIDDVKVPFKSN
jgi:protein O-GlcNAc transferase